VLQPCCWLVSRWPLNGCRRYRRYGELRQAIDAPGHKKRCIGRVLDRVMGCCAAQVRPLRGALRLSWATGFSGIWAARSAKCCHIKRCLECRADTLLIVGHDPAMRELSLELASERTGDDEAEPPAS
jgi:hypothetical protein